MITVRGQTCPFEHSSIVYTCAHRLRRSLYFVRRLPAVIWFLIISDKMNDIAQKWKFEERQGKRLILTWRWKPLPSESLEWETWGRCIRRDSVRPVGGNPSLDSTGATSTTTNCKYLKLSLRWFHLLWWTWVHLARAQLPCLLWFHSGTLAGGQYVDDVKSQLPYFFFSEPYIFLISACIAWYQVCWSILPDRVKWIRR